MNQQDISLSPLLLPSPNPMTQHKTGKYMIPLKMPPLLMLNEPNHHTDSITNSKEKSLDLSLSSTNSEDDDDEEILCGTVNDYRRILKKVKLTDTSNTSNSCNNYHQLKELKRERGYTILDMLELICK